MSDTHGMGSIRGDSTAQLRSKNLAKQGLQYAFFVEHTEFAMYKQKKAEPGECFFLSISSFLKHRVIFFFLFFFCFRPNSPLSQILGF